MGTHLMQLYIWIASDDWVGCMALPAWANAAMCILPCLLVPAWSSRGLQWPWPQQRTPAASTSQQLLCEPANELTLKERAVRPSDAPFLRSRPFPRLLLAPASALRAAPVAVAALVSDDFLCVRAMSAGESSVSVFTIMAMLRTCFFYRAPAATGSKLRLNGTERVIWSPVTVRTCSPSLPPNRPTAGCSVGVQ